MVPGPQSGFKGVAHTTNVPGTMFGVVTGMASRSNYVWLGSTYTKFYEHNGDKRPDVLDYSLVYGYRPPKWRRPPDKWDWRLFGELVGERSNRFLQANVTVPNTQAHQVFLGPTALGIFHNYTVSFGAQFPIYQDVGSAFPQGARSLRGEFQLPAFSARTFTLGDSYEKTVWLYSRRS